MKTKWLIVMILILVAGCTAPVPAAMPTVTRQPDIANPASVYCAQQGYKLEIRTATDGSQSGACVFPGGS